jgi:hypothetical protein
MAGKGYNVKMKRPVKKASDKRRREKVQRKRLIGLGVEAAKVKSLDPSEVRQMLKEPKKLKKKLSKG